MNAPSSSTAPRGTKRKRPDPPAEDPTTKLAGKLHHELKEVRKAAKKARTFETQRVVKKLKGVRKKDPNSSEVGVLEGELEELKTIDSDAIAATALRTRLLKDRHISESAPSRAAITRELPPSATPSVPPPTSKVYTRLLSARALGAAVTQAVAGLRAVLLPPPVAGVSAGSGADAEEEDKEEEEEDEDEDHDGEEDGLDADGDNADAAGWESGSVDGGGGDDDDSEDEEADADGWESGSIHSDDAPPPAKKAAAAKTTTTVKPAKPTPAAKTKPVAATTTTSTSQFLPSLAVGFVRGGSSDSDFNEEEDVDVDGGARKNRRGQRARRAIWEKKYGRGANHKKKEAEEAVKERAEQKVKWEARQAKREAAQASGNAKGRGKWNESVQVADAGWGGRGASVQQGKPPAHAPPRTGTAGAKPDRDAGLHPSWAAKKALKEKMGSGIVPSQGKKIVFSDP